jgi:hypothetical protein
VNGGLGRLYDLPAERNRLLSRALSYYPAATTPRPPPLPALETIFLAFSLSGFLFSRPRSLPLPLSSSLQHFAGRERSAATAAAATAAAAKAAAAHWSEGRCYEISMSDRTRKVIASEALGLGGGRRERTSLWRNAANSASSSRPIGR